MSKEFMCEREVNLPASPEEVWHAVATTEGLASWLFPMPIPALGEGTTSWEPPNHLAIRMEQGDWFNALEYVIDGKAGSSKLRYVHNGIFVDDWETQYDAVQQHTDFYLHTLGQYLEFFQGQTATFIGDVPGGLQGSANSNKPGSFDRMKQALGLDPEIQVGASEHFSPRGLDGFDGTIDYLKPNFVGIRSSSALLRFFGRNAFGQPIGMTIHQFGEVEDAEGIASHWQGWLDTILG